MPTSVLSRGRSLVARLTALAMVASIMVIGALPASAAVDTSDACPAPPSAGFTDIAAFNATTQNAINCLVDYEISTGTTATTYSPNGEVTRWQMALFLTRQAEVHGLTLGDGSDQGFTDIGAFPVTTQLAINQLAQLDITTGTTATTYSPNQVVSRWQMALFLTRLLDAAGFTLGSGVDQGFTDIGAFPASTQTAINQLAQADVADGTSATTYAPADATLRWQMALFLTRVLQVGGVTPDGTIGPNASFTAAPELVSVEKGTAGVVRFNFDTNIPGKQADTEDFRLYNTAGDVANPSEISISGSTVLTRFTTGEVSGAIRGGVRTAAVETGTGLPSIAGGFALSATATQVAPLTPNLISVDNYRFADELVLGTNRVLVDFVFDDPNEVIAGKVTAIDTANTVAAAFRLLGVQGNAFPALEESPSVSHDTDTDTTTVTVAFATDPTDVPQSQLRRGAFDDIGDSDITWTANFAATGGTTVDPDVVSLTQEGSTDVFRFVFDEAISDVDAELVHTLFFLVDDADVVHTGTAITRLADSDAATARVQFDTFDPAVTTALHGWAEDGAVLATDSTDSDFFGQNRAASQPVTIPLVSDPTPGATAAAELLSARRIQNAVTGQFSIELTFDDTVDVSLVDIDLYDAAGVRFAVTDKVNGITGNGTTEITISSANTALSDDEIQATVTVSVQTSDIGVDPVGAVSNATEGQTSATTLVQG